MTRPRPSAGARKTFRVPNKQGGMTTVNESDVIGAVCWNCKGGGVVGEDLIVAHFDRSVPPAGLAHFEHKDGCGDEPIPADDAGDAEPPGHGQGCAR